MNWKFWFDGPADPIVRTTLGRLLPFIIFPLQNRWVFHFHVLCSECRPTTLPYHSCPSFPHDRHAPPLLRTLLLRPPRRVPQAAALGVARALDERGLGLEPGAAAAGAVPGSLAGDVRRCAERRRTAPNPGGPLEPRWLLQSCRGRGTQWGRDKAGPASVGHISQTLHGAAIFADQLGSATFVAGLLFDMSAINCRDLPWGYIPGKL